MMITTPTCTGPWSGPPTTKSVATVSFDCSFPYDLEDLTFTLVPLPGGTETETKEICVMSIVDTPSIKEVNVVINGAWTGSYKVKVLHSTHGYLDLDDLIWSSIAEINDISPS